MQDVTGKVDSQIGLVDLYDVFGLANQTLQGADLLARRLNAVVLIPDFFEGDALPHDVIPADTDTKQKIFNDFRATKANVPRNVGVLMGAVEEYKTRFPSVAKWGAYGLCWGEKVISVILNSPQE
jgi:dienelactone hydrolase